MNDIAPLLAALLLATQTQPAAEPTEPAPELSEPQAAEDATTDLAERTGVANAELADEDDKIICRRTAIVGSRFKKRICATKKEWTTLANRSADTTREWQRRGKGLEPNDVPGT